MLRCFSTLGCPDFSLDAALALAAKHRIDAIELRTLGGTVELPGYFKAHFGSPAALAAHLKAQPVRVLALDTSLRLGPMTDAERAAFLEFVPWAEALGVRWLRVFDARGPIAGAEAIAGAAETMRWWREWRAENRIAADVLVETHSAFFTAATIGRFLAAAPGTAILWDTHHTWRKGGEDPLATWRAIRGSVAHVHVKDSIDVPHGRDLYTYVLPGEGVFPMAPLLASLRADGFAGAVSLEWEKMWHPELPTLDAALASAARHGW